MNQEIVVVLHGIGNPGAMVETFLECGLPALEVPLKRAFPHAVNLELATKAVRRI